MAQESRQHRRDLIETIESQKETINKYETRLRDIVRSYKGLLKEKEVLETTLRALSKADGDNDGAAKPEPELYLPPSQQGSRRGSQQESDAVSTTSEISQDEGNKVKTLTASLASLTLEKSRLESSFQEDRKKLVQDRKQKDKLIESLQKDLQQVKAKAKTESEEHKSKLIVERHEREKEMSDHALMLRELQKVLSDERREKERVEGRLQEALSKLKIQSADDDLKKREEKEKRVQDLEMKLRLRTEEAEKSKRKLEQINGEQELLKKEMMHLKMLHRNEMDIIDKRRENSELAIVKIRMEQEQRVNMLEARTAELSDTIGTYDRLMQHDKAEIARLKEKLTILESKRSTSVPTSSKLEDESLEVLVDKFLNLKKVLTDKNAENDGQLVDLAGLEISNESSEILKWKKEYETLKSEFDNFKVSHNSDSPPVGRYLLPEVDQEAVLSLKTQLGEMQDKVGALKQQLRNMEDERITLLGREREMEEVLKSTKNQMKEKCDALESEYKAKFLQLEMELHKQRERCLTLIEEKEDEIASLKTSLETALEKAFASPDKEAQMRYVAQFSQQSGRKSRNSIKDEDLTEGMKSGNPDGMVLHYVQEISHKSVEISSLRQKLFELESAMREVQMNAVFKEEKYVEEIERLQEEVARSRRMTIKDGSNMDLEYLKNVVLSYMLSNESSSRDHMLKAIGTVLLFSKNEVKRVKDHNASWFWNPQGK